MMLIVKIFVVINCISFLWAAFFFFERPSKKTIKFIAINLTGIVVIANSIWRIYKIDFEEIYIMSLTTFMLVTSFGIFWSTIKACRNFNMKFAFFGEKSSLRAIVKTGTYNFIRHPFYTSYSLTWIGVLIISRDWLSFILIALICLQYYIAAVEEERAILASDLSEDYKQYISRTGRFFLSLKKLKK
jgi:protein-S-isoprenylcysteine O-methyltransferase Ste14